jgi:hypothetical protein
MSLKQTHTYAIVATGHEACGSLFVAGAAGLGKSNLNLPHRRMEASAAVVSAKDGVESVSQSIMETCTIAPASVDHRHRSVGLG